MSKTSIKERNKAIRQAWEREQQLVQECKGTRDWTKKQQQDILDPQKGKAYDDQGRAFQGQHMKSAAEYPEYQGNPDNIQFLTRDEHLEAHKGSWQNPTNWYYNPVTKEYINFGDGGIIPCKIIALNNPISVITESEDVEKEKTSLQSSLQNELSGRTHIPKTPIHEKMPKSKGRLLKIMKGIGQFVVDHPFESIEIVGLVGSGIWKAVSSIRGFGSKSHNSSSSSTTPSTSDKKDVAAKAKIADVIEKANRNTPRENDVPGHKQRYHTKDGVVWKDKGPYHRGGKKE